MEATRMAQQFIDFTYVKQHADFDAILDHFSIMTRGRGNERSALCPFHKETKPSFKANVEKNNWQCFGCGAKGNVLEFVARMLDTNLRAAAEEIGVICDISLSENAAGERDWSYIASRREKTASKGPKSDAGGSTTSPHVETPRKSETRTGEALQSSRAGEGGNKPLSFSLKLDPRHPYLAERRLSLQAAVHFNLGYCKRGLMEGRIAIPIFDNNEELVAYSGRWAADPVPDDVEKYLLPPEFKKTLVLFNLHRLVQPVEHIVMVEGFFDTIRLHLDSVPVVGLMGTSISEEQVALLVGAGTERVTVLMDGNPAGNRAREQLVSVLARQFWVRGPEMPEGTDPDTVDEAWLREHVSLG